MQSILEEKRSNYILDNCSSKGYNYSIMNFGKELKKRRKKLGMSQKQLADELGIYVMTISKWERGEQEPRMPKAILAFLDTLKPTKDGRFKRPGRPPDE